MRVMRNHARLVLAMVVFLVLMVPAAVVLAIDVPRSALRYRADLVRQARIVWGLEAPVASFAAQIHQESAWRADARSSVGAEGLTQFMPSTASWISGAYPRELGESAPLNPAWAIRALVIYDRWLWDRLASVGPACNRMAAALRGYNGGLGYVQKELRTGRPCEAFRAGWACKENLAYPRRILNVLEPVYETAGWGRGVCG